MSGSPYPPPSNTFCGCDGCRVPAECDFTRMSQVSGRGAELIGRMRSLVTVHILGCHSMTANAKELIAHLIQQDFRY